MGFSSDYLYYFHYSDSIGYLIFCCHSIVTNHKNSEGFYGSPVIIL